MASILNPAKLAIDMSSPSGETIAILDAAKPFGVTQFRIDHKDATVFRLWVDAGPRAGGLLSADATVADVVFMRPNPLRDVLLAVEATREQLHEHLHEQLGDYPYARLWMAKHLVTFKNSRLVLRELLQKGPIPGWMWPRFQAALEREHGLGLKASKTRYELVDKDSDVATTVTKPKRKVATVKPEIKKPPRKPKCPLHMKEMKYEGVRGVWACTEEGCKQIAVPKRERIEGQLLLGKGKVSVRIVYPDVGEEPRLVLISDDNVALDVTELLVEDLQTLIEDFLIDEVITTAKKSGVEEVSTKKIKLTIGSVTTVMGVDNAP